MLKSLFTLLLLGILCLPAIAQDTLANTTRLKVGVPAFAPFAYINENNEMSGVMVRYLDLLTVDTGFEFELVLQPYARVLAGVKSGELDLALIFKNAQLEGYADFIGPASSSNVIVLPQASVNLQTYDQLILLGRIAVVRSASFSKTFDEDTKLQKFFVKDYTQGINLLRMGRVDAVVGSVAGIEYNLQQLGLNIVEFGHPYILAQKENWLHFSNKSNHREVINQLKSSVAKHYQHGLMYQLYKEEFPAREAIYSIP
jgi:polar amino acid transport system substrate-binding protein